ncbi:MAG: NADH:flavin oxidoreductase [Bacteriovoracaceae bacterium]
MNYSRFSPLKLRINKTLKNRVVVPPMASETATHLGFVTEQTLSHYQRLAESKAGLVMVEYTFVDKSGRSEEFQLGLNQDSQVEGLSKIAHIIHEKGSMAGIQLTHGGGKSNRDLTDGFLMTPSAIRVPVKEQTLDVGDEMSLEQIALWKKSFVEASKRAHKAGFDLIELHAAHGYGLNQWLSPITNKRTDEYGQDQKGRMKLLLEIISLIQESVPGLLLAVRMPGQDFLEGGLTLKDSLNLAQELEKRGVDIIDISSGIGGWRRPRDRSGEGYLTHEASFIQKNISLPVIGVGGIESGVFIDQALAKKNFSLAAVGRAILKNPKQWGELNLTTQELT